MNKIVLSLLAIMIFTGCQLKPTKVTNQETVILEAGSPQALMRGNPVILDVRPAFEFNLLHVPGSINVRWEDFSQNNPRSRGLLQNDLFAVARRLALIGIDPQTKVVVLGKGPAGQGEEGRVAWTLQTLGIKDVHTVLHTNFREANNTREIPPIKNKSYWKPTVDETSSISLKDFKDLLKKNDPKLIVLDVRTSAEFQHSNLAKISAVSAKMENIEWTRFYNPSGFRMLNLDNLLANTGITKEHTVVVISGHGVRSGAVTYVLRSNGFSKARNFAGGYEQWK